MRRVTMSVLVTAMVLVGAVPAMAGPTGPVIREFEAAGACIEGVPAVEIEAVTSSLEDIPEQLEVYADGTLVAEPEPEDVLVSSELIEAEVFATFEFAVPLEAGSYTVWLVATDSFGSGTSDEVGVTVPECAPSDVCEAGDRRYGKRILDCLGHPYGQVIREQAAAGDPDAEGARRFWERLQGG